MRFWTAVLEFCGYMIGALATTAMMYAIIYYGVEWSFGWSALISTGE